jgi:hypothetical protein
LGGARLTPTGGLNKGVILAPFFGANLTRHKYKCFEKC